MRKWVAILVMVGLFPWCVHAQDKPLPLGQLETIIAGGATSGFDAMIRANSYNQAWLSITSAPRASIPDCRAETLWANFQSYLAIYPAGEYFLFLNTPCGVGNTWAFPSYAYSRDGGFAHNSVHELAHALGHIHPHKLFCNGPGISPPCSYGEHGDPTDWMTTHTVHANAAHKEALGWLSIPIVTSSATFSLAPLHQVAGLRAVKVPYVSPLHPEIVESFLTFEYRTEGDIPTGAKNGLVIHLVERNCLHSDNPCRSPSWETYLVQMQDYAGNSALPFGSCYVFPGNGMTVRVGSPTNGELPISLTFEPTTCPPPVPPPPPPPPAETVPPVVILTAPVGGTVARKSTVTLAATATDNIGVTQVSFLVNGSVVCTDTSQPYGCSWRTPAAPNKRFTISAQARDAAGNVGISNTVSITTR